MLHDEQAHLVAGLHELYKPWRPGQGRIRNPLNETNLGVSLTFDTIDCSRVWKYGSRSLVDMAEGDLVAKIVKACGDWTGLCARRSLA
jgi:hypothetical protein